MEVENEAPYDSYRDEQLYEPENQVQSQARRSSFSGEDSDNPVSSNEYIKNAILEDIVQDGSSSERPGSAKEFFDKEKRRLKMEQDKLRKEEEQLHKQAKEDARAKYESIKKEKERLKREKEVLHKKAKSAIKKESQKQRRLTFDTNKELSDLLDGWMKMRGSFKNWHLRWFVLRPGKLIYYRDELARDCQGIVRLAGCEVHARETKKEGFCFKIFHPRKHSIFSTRGLKGETLPSGIVPLTADHCILRVGTEEERVRWMSVLEEAIKQAKDVPFPYYSSRFSASEDNMMLVNRPRGDSDSENMAKLMEINEDLDLEYTEELDENSEDNTNNMNDAVVQPEEYIVMKRSSKQQLLTNKNRVYKSTLYAPEKSEESQMIDEISGEMIQEEELGQDSRTLVMTLLKQLKIGMDLSRVVLPTFILEPRSMLEKVSDFLTHAELLAQVSKLNDPLDRMVAVVKWYLSGFYIKPKGVKKPYNPIQGEFFRCMWNHSTNSKTFFISEQVSHHPPISAFYASNRKEGFVVNGSILFRSRFNGTSVGSILDGFATICILPHNEEYEVTFPSAFAKGFLFGTLLMELVGPVTVLCRQSGYRAEIDFKQKPMLGGEYNVVHARIRHGKETLYTIHGKWDKELEIVNNSTKQSSILWSPTPAIRKNKMIKQKPVPEQMSDFESDKLWHKVSDAIRTGDQVTATNEKATLEQAQREAAKYREANKIVYKPRLFFKNEQAGVWMYKYMNKSLWDSEREIEEYEVNGIIRSRKEDGSSSDASDDDELMENRELKQAIHNRLPSSPNYIPPQLLQQQQQQQQQIITAVSSTPPTERRSSVSKTNANYNNNNYTNTAPSLNNSSMNIPSSPTNSSRTTNNRISPNSSPQVARRHVSNKPSRFAEDNALDVWKKDMETRVLKVEKEMLMLQHKMQSQQQLLAQPKVVGRQLDILTMIWVLFVCIAVYYLFFK